MRKFKIDKDWKDVDCDIYQKGTVTIEPGVTILFGCNGIYEHYRNFILKTREHKNNRVYGNQSTRTKRKGAKKS